jgi:1,2-diacylglycerol 3-alpha-glucosyltransferase
MRICIASTGLGHVARGIESWAHDLGRALHQRGHAVTLCKGGGTRETDLEHVLPCLKRTCASNKRIMRLLPKAMWRVGLSNVYDLEQLTFLPALLRHLRRHRSEVLHVQDPLIALWVQRAHHMGIVPTRVILNHGTNEPYSFLDKITYLQHGAPLHLENARNDGCYKDTWRAIPNFIDTDTFRPGRCDEMRRELNIPDNALVVLCVAAIKRVHKRIDHLIGEVATLRKTAPELPIYLIVAGGAEADTDELIENGRAQLHDRFIGLVNFPRTRIPGLYRTADCFVLCSLREMMPMVLLEATASGLPCLINAHPSVQWIVGPGGRNIDMASQGALAHALGEICSIDSLRLHLGRHARRQCEINFSRDRVIDQILDYYRFVISHARHSVAELNLLNLHKPVIPSAAGISNSAAPTSP